MGAGCTGRGSGRPPAPPCTSPSPTRTTMPSCKSGRSGHLAVPDRSVLRAAADPGHAEHLGRHGAVQRHAARQRDGVPDDHRGAQVLPPAHPERGQRPLLEPAVVRGRPEDGDRQRGGAEPRRSWRRRRSTRSSSPTPEHATDWSARCGPSWIQIGTEGGFLPAPVVVRQQPITWITDPTRFDVGNVDLHSLLLAPAERADVIVDFSDYAGKTLILYNDAPAAFPARVPSYDYYTGAPDLSPVGAPPILPGYGPNTRTIMQVKVAAAAPAPAFNLAALQAAFSHHADGSGVFESGQHPIIVGQAAYNSAYGTSFAASSWCNGPGGTTTACDGMAADLGAGRRPVRVQHPARAHRQARDQDRAQGHPRRDERLGLRRVRPDDGQPRPRGRPGHAGRCRTSSSTRTSTRRRS